MLTAAEVSCQDFDPQFRLDCQRITARERVRCKVSAAKERGVVGNFGPEALNRKVVAPDFAMCGAREEVPLERGLVVDTD